jgi:hypothetical protein
MTGTGLRTLVLELIGNIFVAAAAIGAVTFLFRREFVRFAEFAVLAVLVATFVYAPEVWIGVGRAVANVIGSDTPGAAGSLGVGGLGS